MLTTIRAMGAPEDRGVEQVEQLLEGAAFGLALDDRGDY